MITTWDVDISALKYQAPKSPFHTFLMWDRKLNVEKAAGLWLYVVTLQCLTSVKTLNTCTTQDRLSWQELSSSYRVSGLVSTFYTAQLHIISFISSVKQLVQFWVHRATKKVQRTRVQLKMRQLFRYLNIYIMWESGSGAQWQSRVVTQGWAEICVLNESRLHHNGAGECIITKSAMKKTLWAQPMAAKKQGL